MKKGQMVKVIDKGFAEHLTTMETLFGSGDAPDLQGELLAINPTAEEFATFDNNFRDAVAFGVTSTEELEGVAVYFDKGAGRAFALGVHMIAPVDAPVEEENNEEEKSMVEAKFGDVVKATGMGELFVGLVGGSGRGKVVHVGKADYTIQDPIIQQEYAEGKLQEVHLSEGVIYIDEGLGDTMWLAGDDYEVVGE